MSPPSSEPQPRETLEEVSRDFDTAEEAAERWTAKALKGHARLSRILRVADGVLREQAVEGVGLAASGATFWLVIAAFPTAIAVVSLFGLVVSPERVADDLGRLASGTPASVGSLITAQLRRVAASDHAGLSVGLAVSVLLAVWSASAGVYNLDRAIRVAYGLPPQRYVEARGRALAGAVAVVVGLGLSALAISVVDGRSPAMVVVIVFIPIVLVLISAAVTGLYRFAVGGGVPLRSLLPGAVTSSIGVVAVVAGFGAYVAGSSHYTAVYGVFAGAVIGMLGTYLAVYVILLGAVLNVQLASTPRPGGRVGPPGSSSGAGTP
jgi:membrane protein